MKINNIKKGMVLKSYKELCNVLEIPIKSGGDSKKSQLTELERYFKFHKDGNKFVIDRVYSIPKDKFDGRGKSEGSRGNNSLYKEDIQFLIMNILAEENEGTIQLSCSKLLNVLNLVNDNYTVGEKNIEGLSKATNIPLENCVDFYMYSRNNMKVKIETALNGLEKKRLLLWEKIFFIDITEVVEGQLKRNHRQATDSEKKEILSIEKETVDEMKLESIPYISEGKMKEFRKKVRDKLLEVGLDINYYYKAYNITFLKKYIEKEIEKEVQKVALNLNDKMIKAINKEAGSRNARANKKVDELIMADGENDGTIKFSKLHYSDDYVLYAEQLTDLLIRLETGKFSM